MSFYAWQTCKGGFVLGDMKILFDPVQQIWSVFHFGERIAEIGRLITAKIFAEARLFAA